MSDKSEQLKNLLEDIDYPHLLDFIKGVWYMSEDEVHWNSDYTCDDLYNGNGDTYSAEVTEGTGQWEGFTIINYDNGCGVTQTGLFDNQHKTTFEELEEHYS